MRTMTMRLLIRLSFSVNFLAKHEMILAPHTPYSPVLTHIGVFFFPKLKSALEDRRFQGKEETEENFARRSPQHFKNEFLNVLQKW